MLRAVTRFGIEQPTRKQCCNTTHAAHTVYTATGLPFSPLSATIPSLLHSCLFWNLPARCSFYSHQCNKTTRRKHAHNRLLAAAVISSVNVGKAKQDLHAPHRGRTCRHCGIHTDCLPARSYAAGSIVAVTIASNDPAQSPAIDDTTVSRKLVPAVSSCMFTGVSTPVHKTTPRVSDLHLQVNSNAV